MISAVIFSAVPVLHEKTHLPVLVDDAEEAAVAGGVAHVIVDVRQKNVRADDGGVNLETVKQLVAETSDNSGRNNVFKRIRHLTILSRQVEENCARIRDSDLVDRSPRTFDAKYFFRNFLRRHYPWQVQGVLLSLVDDKAPPLHSTWERSKTEYSRLHYYDNRYFKKRKPRLSFFSKTSMIYSNFLL